jgi:hypothetical protein
MTFGSNLCFVRIDYRCEKKKRWRVKISLVVDVSDNSPDSKLV